MNRNKLEDNSEQICLANEYVEEAIRFLKEGRLNEAEKTTLRAIEIYREQHQMRQLAFTLNLLFVIYDDFGNDAAAVECLLDALDIVLAEGIYDTMTKIYINLGSILKNLKSFEQAEVYFQAASDAFEKAQSLGMLKEAEERSILLVLNMNLASVHCKTGNFKKAEKYYLAAKEKAEKEANQDFSFTFRSFEIYVLWKIGQKENAEKLLDSLLEELQHANYTRDYQEVMASILELLEELEDYSRWEQILMLMEHHLEENVGIKVQLELKKRWVEYYQRIGNTEKYQQYCAEFFVLWQKKEEADIRKAADVMELKVEMRASARQRKRTEKLINLDPLTQVGNRNKLTEDSKEYLANSIEKHAPVTIGLIDLDHFKECNDTWGHIIGDLCLQKVAEIMKEKVGSKGSIYRYGGDEFVLLLSETDEEGVRNLAEEIKQALDKTRIADGKSAQNIRMTVSQGYACTYASGQDSLQELISLADQSLYFVKRNGRNHYHILMEEK